jgi:hypothetical protein
MRLDPESHEILIANALQYFKAHESTGLSLCKVAQLFGPTYGTLLNQRYGKTRSVKANGGQNRLLSPTQEACVIDYICRQAYADFPATWQMIVETVTFIRSQDNLPSPLHSWAKRFFQQNGPQFKTNFHKIKWKPMDRKRRAAGDPETVIQ